MADDVLEILYFAPSAPARTPVADYARSYGDALRSGEEIAVVPMLGQEATESLDGMEDGIRLVKRGVDAALRGIPAGENQVIHAELGRATLREFWAAHFAGAQRADSPLCLTLHDPPDLTDLPPPRDVDASGGFFDRMLTAFSGRLSTLGQKGVAAGILERASLIVALSAEGAERLAEKYPNHRPKIGHLPPMIVGSVPENLEPISRSSSELLLIATLGFVGPGRGIEQLIDALALLKREMTLTGRVRLTIRGRLAETGGAKSWVGNIQRRIEGTGLVRVVDFRPEALSDPAIDQLLAGTDILVLPHLESAASDARQAFMRAQAWAVAVVASRVGAAAEAIEDGHEGILVEPGDIGALAEGLERLIKQGDVRTSMAKALRQRALNERPPQVVAERMRNLYREILAARKEGREAKLPVEMQLDGGEAND